MFTYSHANTRLSQSERAYCLSYFINTHMHHEHFVTSIYLINQDVTFLRYTWKGGTNQNFAQSCTWNGVQRERQFQERKYSSWFNSFPCRHQIIYVRNQKIQSWNLELTFSSYLASISNNVKRTEVRSSIAPDPEAIFLGMELQSELKRGPRRWKFNNALLEGQDYIDIISFISALKH